MLRNEPGWLGTFTRDQAPGAIPNGTLIEKTYCEPGDAHPRGTVGVVLGSFRPDEPVPGYEHVQHFYFVEWRPRPRVASGVVDFKIRRLGQEFDA